ncbi:MAG: hypothetical protein ABI563_16955 [Specibacter sp.]
MTDSAPAPAETTTTPTRSIAVQLWLGTVVALAVAAGWFLLAVTHPTTTYHFDPFLVVLAPFALLRPRRAASPWRLVLAGSAIGAALALAVTLLLDGVGALRGPALLRSLSPTPEALIAIVLGIAVVVASTRIRQARSAH